MLPKEKNNHNWKDYVFSWPTYLILGIALTDLVIRTEALNPLITKFWKEKEKNSF